MAAAMNNAEDLFLNVLSRLYQAEQREVRVADEMSQIAQTKEGKEALTVRAYLGKQEAANIEECFQLLGEQPRQITPSRFGEVAAEEFRMEINAIQSPALKTLYALHAVRTIQDIHIGEYKTLVVMARLAEQWGVAALLERNLANKLVFEERTDEIIRAIAKTAFARWLKAKAAA